MGTWENLPCPCKSCISPLFQSQTIQYNWKGHNSLGSDEVQSLWLLLLLLLPLLGVGKHPDNFTALGMCKTQVRNSPWPEKLAVLLVKTDSGRERRQREMGAGTRSN